MIKTLIKPILINSNNINKNKIILNSVYNYNNSINRYYSSNNNNSNRNVLYSFGAFDNMKLGVPGNQDKLLPTPITHLPPFLKIKQFGSSWLNSFILTDEQQQQQNENNKENENNNNNNNKEEKSNRVFMWGTNKSGNMALPSEQYRFPVQLDILKNTFIEKVVGGRSFTLALTREGKVLAFGENNFGQLGLGDLSNRTAPTPVESLNNQQIVDIGVGLDHSMAVTKSGHVFGWGYNVEGQIGQKVVEYTRMKSTTESIEDKQKQNEDGDDEVVDLREQMIPDVEYILPTLVPGLEQIKISKVFCGYDCSFLLSARGNVYSFGTNEVGALGLGSDLKGRVTKPTKVKFDGTNEKIKMLSSGASHTLFLTNGGKVYACGWGTEGRLGLGMDTSNRDNPTLVDWFVDNDIKIVKVAAGGSHSLALDEDGKIYSWGNGSNGKLGHDNETDSNIPKQIEFFKNLKVKDIFAGIDNSLVLVEN